jgi:hypothetical protein
MCLHCARVKVYEKGCCTNLIARWIRSAQMTAKTSIYKALFAIINKNLFKTNDKHILGTLLKF